MALPFTGLQAKGAKWQKLLPIYKYHASAFHLKDTIETLEIKREGDQVWSKVIDLKW